MRRAALIACVAGFACPLAVAADGYDGLYYPEGYGTWSCTEDTIGQDGGTLAIKGEQLFGVENTCRLTNPVDVRDMNATLFDRVCSSEGETYTDRLLIASSLKGVILLNNGFASTWLRCP